jgi:prepilin-type N-terminal cleavage/methylation domain-containing protein
MKMFRKEEGFTLVELMVVVLIIGILIAIAIPVFNAAKGNAQKKSCFANQRTIEGACQTYQADSGTLPTGGTINSGFTALVPSYVKTAPYCPLVGTASYYTVDSSGTVTGDSGTGTWNTGHSHF